MIKIEWPPLPEGNFDQAGGDKPGFSENATSTVNVGIDTPLMTSDEDGRPMWGWIAKNDKYLDQYHKVYDELLKIYFENGECLKEIERVHDMIAPYVGSESGSESFYSNDEFESAVTNLKAFVDARAKSIRKQLDGDFSTKTAEQNDSDCMDASNVDIKAMGSQGGDKGGFER